MSKTRKDSRELKTTRRVSPACKPKMTPYKRESRSERMKEY